MGFVFLLVRFLFGGLFAYQGARYLTVYGRPAIAARFRALGIPAADFAVVVSGLAMLAGGVSILTGVAPAFGVAVIVAFVATVAIVVHPFWRVTGETRRAEALRFGRLIAVSILALAFLAVPRPWPYTLIS